MDPNQRPRDTQRRYATVLFADLTGFTPLGEELDAERVYGIVTGYLKLLDGIARKWGGSVDKYLGDAVMATFGVPLTVEEGPRAAVNAAIEIRNEVERYNAEGRSPVPLGVHSGINSGLLISGDVSGPVLREFAVMGDAVNIAFRLKDLAPSGEIWVGPDTFRYSRDAFEYRPLEPIAVKGKARKVRIYELRSRHPRPYKIRGTAEGERSDLVGRSVLLRRLGDALARASTGEGRVTTLAGDPGVGKSRLVTELAASPSAEGARFLVGRCLEQGQTWSHHPIVDMLRGWAGVRDHQDGAEVATAVREAIGDLLDDAEAAEVEPFLLRLLLGRAADEDARLSGIRGEALERLLFHSVDRLLLRLSLEQPLALVFEDLHWADASTLRLLEWLLPRFLHRPILCLLVSRADSPAARGLVEAAGPEVAARHERLEVAPLAREESSELLDRLLRGTRLPGTTRALILERSAGNPFFMEEVTRFLLEERAEAGASVADGEAGIPTSIREVITSRIDRLEERPRRLLETLSVVGRRCPAALAAALAPDRAALERDAEPLARVGLLETGPAGYAFRHALIQDVTYASLLLSRREELHRRVAEVIDRDFRSRLPAANAMLAYHFGLARSAEQAERALFEAGDEAMRSAASDEALHFFNEAYRLYVGRHAGDADPERLAHLERSIALAHHIRGDFIEAGRHLSLALEGLGEPASRQRWREPLRFARTLATVVGDLYRPRRVERRPPAGPREREIIELMTHRAEAQTLADPRRFLLDTMETHRALARVDPRTVDGAGGLLAGLVGIFSWGGLSFSLGERALHLAERLLDPSDPREALMVRLMRFVHGFARGAWDEELAIPADLLDAGLRYGRLWHVANYRGLRAEQLAYRGELEAAQHEIGQLERMADDYGYDLAAATADYQRAFLLSRRGDLPEALAAIDRYYAGKREDVFRIGSLSERAKLQLLLGDREAAAASLEQAAHIVSAAGMVAPYYMSMYWRSRLLLDVADLARGGEGRSPAAARARRSAARALRVADRMVPRRPEILRIESERQRLLGRERASRDRWRRGVEEARRLGMRLESGDGPDAPPAPAPRRVAGP